MDRSRALRPRDLPRGYGRVSRRPKADGSVKFLAQWPVKDADGLWAERSRQFATEAEAKHHLWEMARVRVGGRTWPRALEFPKLATIYFLQGRDGGPVKIGITDDVQRRVADIQAGSPVPLRVVGTMDGDRETEADLHRAFARLRLHGEWFGPDDVLLRWVAQNATTWDEAVAEKRAFPERLLDREEAQRPPEATIGTLQSDPFVPNFAGKARKIGLITATNDRSHPRPSGPHPEHPDQDPDPAVGRCESLTHGFQEAPMDPQDSPDLDALATALVTKWTTYLDAPDGEPVQAWVVCRRLAAQVLLELGRQGFEVVPAGVVADCHAELGVAAETIGDLVARLARLARDERD